MLNFTLKVWRQNSRREPGEFAIYLAKNISPDMSFLEMLDLINEELILTGQEPITFDHDCREGICGSCGAIVNGIAHGPKDKITLCQLHMRSFKSGDIIVIEPFRARAFPIIKDIMVERSSLDRIIGAGGFISVKTGGCPDANAIPVNKGNADKAFDAATCIGCGACVAACPNASASLFVSAKASHLSLLPQGKVESKERIQSLVWQMDKEGFGNCSNSYQCEAACPKGISVENIARMNRELLKAKL